MIAATELHEVPVRQAYAPTGQTVEAILTHRRDDGSTVEQWFPVVAVVKGPGRYVWVRVEGPERLVVVP